ncbi:MAG: hypothetical protein DI564_16435 [Rhodanobacter denitrificans]|uniref:Methyltransferase FkbM domain-containing protein n=1 Tax=Rhodanobacter denitrificans TaxID=666685 RepID=A0A2W5K2G5_9GAMM|nr:MAG: hypothetical protein DI564_16435 [Rhodanobacter denitrificans]
MTIPMHELAFDAAGSDDLVEVPFNGVKLFPWRGDDLIGRHVIGSRSYEPHVLPRFLDSLSAGASVLDVGANIGTFSLTAAKAVGARGTVISVEPIAKNLRSLLAGARANGFGHMTILPVAASGHRHVVSMLRSADSSNGIVDEHIAEETADSRVEAVRLDEALAHLTRIDVVKIDIEGHEPIAWPGMCALISRHRPMVFSEMNPLAIRNHSRLDAPVYLDMLFAHTDAIYVLHLGGRIVRCTSTQEIMREWVEVNRRHGSNGEIFVDLMFQAIR